MGEGDQWVCTITNTVDETTGTIEVVKNLVPTDDPGRFDLQIDGVDEATNAGHNGTTGVKTVPTGSHTVGETGGDTPTTDLNDYGRSVECLEDSNTASPINKNGSGPVNVPVEDGDVWVCTITNDGTFVPPPPVGGVTDFFGAGSGSAGLSSAGLLYGVAIAVIGIVAAGAWYSRRQPPGKRAA